MNVLLASCMTLPSRCPVVKAFTDLAARDTSMRHQLVQKFEVADCILFVDLHMCPDPSLVALRSNPLVRQVEDRVCVYDERDKPWCSFPGVYVSMPRKYFDVTKQRAFSYYASNPATLSPLNSEPEILFSFIGAPGSKASKGYSVRHTLLLLRHPNSIVEDSTGFSFHDDHGDPMFYQARQKRFTEIMDRSKFVLCPRGWGTSSIRMYEALRAGRVPVILSDDWVAPTGPDWSKFSLRLSERDAEHVPYVIHANEHRWQEMSRAASNAYEDWFSPSVSVSRIFDLCENILQSNSRMTPSWRNTSYWSMRVHTAKEKARRMAGASFRALSLRRRRI